MPAKIPTTNRGEVACRVIEAAADVLRLLGHNMPPAGEELGAGE